MNSGRSAPKISPPGLVHKFGRAVGIRFRGVKGVDDFLRFLHDPDRRRESWVETESEPWQDGPKYHLSTRWFTEWTTWFYGTQDVEIYNWLTKNSQRDWVALDIGMNFGFFACLLAKRCAFVYGFEPVPWLAKRAGANAALNDFKNLAITEMALSDRTGKVMLNVPDENEANWGTSSLVHVASGGAKPIEVATDTLDNFAAKNHFTRLDFIKLDVEGAESLVMKGGLQTIAKFRPAIIFERNEESCDDVMELLSSLNYKFFDLTQHPLAREKNLWPSDILAAPPGSALASA